MQVLPSLKPRRVKMKNMQNYRKFSNKKIMNTRTKKNSKDPKKVLGRKKVCLRKKTLSE